MNTQLNKIPSMKTGFLGLAMLLLSSFFTVQATDLSYSSVPLFDANGVQPNVAMIIDNSSSMTNTDTGGSGTVSRVCTTGSDTAPLTRIQAAENAACTVINNNASNMRIGLWDFSTASPGSAVQVNNFGAATAAQMDASIAGFVANSYGTPLSSAMQTAMTAYFGSSSPIQYRCQKNFVVLFTDGSADAGIDENSSITLPSLNNSTQQSSTWNGATGVQTGSTVSSPGWDGFPDPNITWAYPTVSGSGYTYSYYTYYTWLDDLSQMGYDVSIKDTSSPAISSATCGGSTSSSTGTDCAGKSWNGANDTSSSAYRQQNVTTYTIGFGDESNNEVMRDTPLVNQIAITPSQVNTSADTITITNHGLSTGAFVHYYTAYTTPVYTGAGNSGTDEIGFTSTFTTPTTGTALTYSNAGGTTQQYNQTTNQITGTCGPIGGLTSGSTNNFVAVPASGEFRFGNGNSSFNAFACAKTADGAVNANCLNLSGTGTQYTTHTFTVTAHTATFQFATASTTHVFTPVDATAKYEDITIAGHGFSTGNAVKLTSGSFGGLSTSTTYYVAKISANVFRLATSSGNATNCAAAADNTANVTTYCVTLTTAGTVGANEVFTNTSPANDGASVTITAGATGSTTPVNATANYEDIIVSHSFLTGDQVTYTCTNEAAPGHSVTAPANIPSTVYAIYVDATHFELADTYAHAISGTALDLSNGGNAAQTFTAPVVAESTIGGLFPYTTDQPPTASNPVYSSTSPSNAEGKYYVEVVDPNTIKLHQCGATEVLTGHTLYCALEVATAVNLTSTGYGTMSTGPGKYYGAESAADIAADLQNAFLSISAQTLSQASLTVSATSYGSGSAYAYSASFNTSDWSGDIKAYPIGTNGTISTTAGWDASNVMPSPSARTLITATTFNTAGAGAVALPLTATTGLTSNELVGIGNGAGSLSPGNLTSAQQTLVLDWVSGTDESTLSGSRTRSNGVIGDILNGSPIYVGSPSSSYNTTLPAGMAGQSTYATFTSTYANRTPMLYVGANDGMLHGFNANTGVESFGFIPQGVYMDWVDNATGTNGVQDVGETSIQKFYERTQSGYGYATATQPHRYFVDGPPAEGDAYFSTAQAGIAANNWHSVVVGGLGKGGRSIYALDVTNPSSFTTSNVLWEFNDSSGSSKMGYTYGKPTIAHVCKTGTVTAGVFTCTASYWAAIFANGYNAASNKGSLYVVNIETGAAIARLDTTSGSGLSTATVYTPSSGTYQGYATYAYAGDLSGNVWRFSLAPTSSGAATLLYTATDSAGNAQAITAAPVVVDATAVPYSLASGQIVIVGTGTYFQTSDASYTSGTTKPNYNSLYSIWDADDTTQVTLSNLEPQTISTVACIGSTYTSCRVLSSNPVTYTGTGGGSKGWYINLYTSLTSENGERIAYQPVQVGYDVSFSTIVPLNTDPCTGGGTGWLYAVNAATGGAATALNVDGSGYTNTISGVESTVGVLTQVVFVAASSGGTSGEVYVQGSNGAMIGLNIDATCAAAGKCTTPSTFTGNAGRMTWRQLQ